MTGNKGIGRMIRMVMALAALVLTACATLPRQAAGEGEIMEGKDQKPAHHAAKGYRNLYIDDSDKAGFFRVTSHLLFKEPRPDESELALAPPTPSQQPDMTRITQPDPADLQVTWIGHSTMLVQYQGLNILTDPVFSERASPLAFVGPRRYTKPAIAIADLPPIDIVVISHNHYDHLDLSSISALGNDVHWMVPLDNGALLEEAGVSNYTELDWWGQHVEKDVRLTLTPSQHWSARGLFDRYAMLWGAWAMEFGDGTNIWFGGDTGYNNIQFRETGDRLGPFDLALIPIGAYEPRQFMKHSHINPEEAVRIHQDIDSQFSIGVHWGTFVLTTEPVDEPPKRLQSAADAAGLAPDSFISMSLGETRKVDRIVRSKAASAQ